MKGQPWQDETVQTLKGAYQEEIATLRAREVCAGCGTNKIDMIVSVINGAVACCPDCTTLTVAERNAIRAAKDAQIAALRKGYEAAQTFAERLPREVRVKYFIGGHDVVESVIEYAAALVKERDALFQIAVKSMQAVEQMGFVELKGKAQELDHALANDIPDELWERINAAALKGETK